MLPVSVKQLLEARQEESGDSMKVDGRETNQVTVVALILNVTESSSSVNYTLDDGTGTIDARVWLDQVRYPPLRLFRPLSVTACAHYGEAICFAPYVHSDEAPDGAKGQQLLSDSVPPRMLPAAEPLIPVDVSLSASPPHRTRARRTCSSAAS